LDPERPDDLVIVQLKLPTQIAGIINFIPMYWESTSSCLYVAASSSSAAGIFKYSTYASFVTGNPPLTPTKLGDDLGNSFSKLSGNGEFIYDNVNRLMKVLSNTGTWTDYDTVFPIGQTDVVKLTPMLFKNSALAIFAADMKSGTVYLNNIDLRDTG